MLRLSSFGEKFAARSGILELMGDLGSALVRPDDVCMLGGGNPAPVPAMQELLRARMRSLLADGDAFDRMLGHYDSPQGPERFLEALACLFREHLGWDVGVGNIALTNGSQSAFFFLFNMFAGEFADGSRRRILLPLTPEYIGYVDLGLSSDFFVTCKPQIELLPDRLFKYHIDFDRLRVTPDIGAICVSRPTNPSGNVLTDEEVRRLSELAATHGIPLISDNAYGAPFPNILFTDVEPVWNEHMVLSMSLSKIGLPATRTGVVIASEAIIKAVSRINAVVSLATGSVGAALVEDMVVTGDILRVSREIIQPFYRQRAVAALAVLQTALSATPVDYRVHRPEGSMFLWIWFRNLAITSRELYERLKRRGVLVVPGEYFFPGPQDGWEHRHQCLRINYSHDPAAVRAGLQIIAEEAARAVGEKTAPGGFEAGGSQRDEFE